MIVGKELEITDEKNIFEFDKHNKLEWLEVSAKIPTGCTNIFLNICQSINNALLTLNSFPG